MEFDEKELRREITYAIKNIHGIRYPKIFNLSNVSSFNFYRASKLTSHIYIKLIYFLSKFIVHLVVIIPNVSDN